MKIVGFTGAKYAGKDTAARALVSGGFVKVSFAGPMKLMVGELMKYRGATNDAIWEALEGSQKETPCKFLSGQTPRRVLQTIGTEWGRDMLTQSFWLDAFQDRVQAIREKPYSSRGIVVTDVRFDNEAQMILDQGGQVYRVVRPGLAGGDVHVSEKGVSDHFITHTFVNDLPYPEDFCVRVHQHFFPQD